MLGKKHSEETKKLMKDSQLKISGRKILQYDLDMNLIKEWPGINEAGRILNISAGLICNCCKGKYQKAYGFIWKYKEE